MENKTIILKPDEQIKFYDKNDNLIGGIYKSMLENAEIKVYITKCGLRYSATCDFKGGLANYLFDNYKIVVFEQEVKEFLASIEKKITREL